MRRGEVWDVTIDEEGPTQRFLIVSNKAWNEAASPQCVPLLHGHGESEVIPFIVLMNEPDPLTGALELGGLGPVPHDAFVESVGMLTGATMAKVSDCLRKIYEL